MADLCPAFDFNIPNNRKTVPDSWTVDIEQNVRSQVGIYCEKFQPKLTKSCFLLDQRVVSIRNG